MPAFPAILLLLCIVFHSTARLLPARPSADTCTQAVPGLSPGVLWDTCPIPVDQWTHPSEDGRPPPEPWSYHPHCFQPGHKPNYSSPYCLYTHRTFRGNNGIGIITTPELAATVVGALDDGVVQPQHKNHPSSPLFVPPSISTGTRHRGRANPVAAAASAAPYEVKDLPGRGKGAVATRQIKAWETVMVDFPVFVMQMDLFEALEPKQSRRLLKRALRQLPEHQQGRVLALARNTRVEDPVEDVLRTNNFGLELNGVLHMGLFVEGSRVNHNCQPNVFWRYDSKSMAMEVVAIRHIEPGEEIAHSYVTLGSTYAQRQSELSEWGFKCTCALCSAPPKERRLSDARRERLFDLSDSLRDPGEMQEIRLSQLVRELVELVDQEQLWPQMVVYYPHIARAYIEIGSLDRAKRYIELAEQSWINYQGVEHENVEGIRRLWEEVKEAEEGW